MRSLLIALTMILIFAGLAQAANNFETISVTNGAVSTFTSTKVEDPSKTHQNAEEAFCTTTGAINVTMDGTTPTTSTSGVGHQIPVGGSIDIVGHANIMAVKMIGTSGNSSVTCTYFFDRN